MFLFFLHWEFLNTCQDKKIPATKLVEGPHQSSFVMARDKLEHKIMQLAYGGNFHYHNEGGAGICPINTSNTIV
jgi:hypothetical protein